MCDWRAGAAAGSARTTGVLLLLFLVPVRGGADNERHIEVPYAHMAPVMEYLAPSPDAEAALARSAAPGAISANATVLALTTRGYETVAKGTNGFICIVERSWMSPFDNPQFWNPKLRAPVCYNPPAARSVLPYTLHRTKLVLAGISKTQMLADHSRGLRPRRSSSAGTGRDVVHAVKGGLPRRRLRSLVSAPDVSCPENRSFDLGREPPGLSCAAGFSSPGSP